MIFSFLNRVYSWKMLGYFTQIEMLENKIKELETKLEEERREHKEAYMRLKQSSAVHCVSSNTSDYELHFLHKENARLREENERLKNKK